MATPVGHLDLAEFFARGVEPADTAPLYPLLGARGLISACIAVFRGGEAEVLVRLLVLREIGARADNPSWSPRELEMHFGFIDPVKLETVLKRLREHDLLVWDVDRRTYQISPTGRMVLAALSTLLQFAAEEDAELGYLTAQIAAGGATGRISPENLQHLLARLAELEDEFSSAVAFGSEFRLQAAQSKLASVWQWMEKGTEIMRGLTADGLPDDATWRLAQEIGARQSRIMRMTGVFQRELAAIARQRVHLSQGGLTSSELAAWLTTRDIDQLADFAVGATHLVPEVPFVLPDVMADVAEFELLERQRPERQRSTLPAAVDAENTREIPREPPPELAALTRLLADLATRDEGLAVSDAIVGDSFRAAAYRFSLLPFLGDPSGDPELAAFGALPLTLRWADDETLATPQRNEVAAISRGTIQPPENRMNANTPAEFVARLLAQRWLPKSDAEVRRLLIDESFRQDIEHRLAAVGLRLLDNPFAAHVAVGLAANAENPVFGRGDAWLSNNAGLNRDGVALLILLWALIILPKRERQLSREATTDEGQTDLFGNQQAAPLRDDAARGVPENVLLEDYGKLLGGKARLQFLLPMLSRLGFIERRNKVLHEGPLLDLAFDYAELAPRILDGALADVLAAVNGKNAAKMASTATGDA